MTWQFFESSPGCHTAYQLQEGKILINDQICYGRDESMDVCDDSATEAVTLNPDGTFILESNELQQFNCCNNLWATIELINSLTEKKILNKADILSEESLFKVHSVEYNGQYKDWKFPVDLKFSFIIDANFYGDNHQQFIKYAFLDKKITQKAWTISTLANFTLHMMKFMYEVEKSGPNKTTEYSNTDRDVVALLESKGK